MLGTGGCAFLSKSGTENEPRSHYKVFPKGKIGNLEIKNRLVKTATDLGATAEKKLKKKPHALSISEIREIRNRYVAAAKRAKAAGFDGIQLHGTHSFLLNTFLSPYSNKRIDMYGGSVQNMMRIVKEMTDEIKSSLGSDYPASLPSLATATWYPTLVSISFASLRLTGLSSARRIRTECFNSSLTVNCVAMGAKYVSGPA